MALTETNKVDLIEVVGEHTIQVRTTTVIERDNTEISRSHQRHVLEPGMDLSNQDPRVQAIAGTLWTAEVIAAFQLAVNQDKIA